MKGSSTSALMWSGAVALLLFGCATAPVTKFYELSVRSDVQTTTSPTSELVVERVRVPEGLMRTQMVVQTSENEAEVLEDYQWLSPMDDQLGRTLTGDLQAALPNIRVTGDRARNSSGRRFLVRVEIQRLTARRAGRVLLAASWSVSASASQVIRQGQALVEAPVMGSGYDAIPPAISKAVQQLSLRIADSFSNARCDSFKEPARVAPVAATDCFTSD